MDKFSGQADKPWGIDLSVGARVIPSGIGFRVEQLQGRTYTRDGNITQNVEFDVAASVRDAEEDRGMSLVVCAISVTSGNTAHFTQLVNRLKFTIPVLFPASLV